MKRSFVKTENAQRFRNHVAAARNSGAKEAQGMIVHGRPGEGKTACLHRYGSDTQGVFLTGQPDWTITRMMSRIAAQLGLTIDRNLDTRIIQALMGDFEEPLPIIVDEAGFGLANNAACIEKLRCITDQSYSPLILCFMSNDMRILDSSKYRQLSSRIATRCEFKKSTLEDVSKVFAELCEWQVDESLAHAVHQKTDGRMRLIMNSVARIEQFAKVSKMPKGSAVKFEQIRDKGLFEDFIVSARGMQ